MGSASSAEAVSSIPLAGRWLWPVPDGEEIIFAEIDPSAARDKHITRVPGKHQINRFKDRRPQYYGKIVEAPDPD